LRLQHTRPVIGSGVQALLCRRRRQRRYRRHGRGV